MNHSINKKKILKATARNRQWIEYFPSVHCLTLLFYFFTIAMPLSVTAASTKGVEPLPLVMVTAVTEKNVNPPKEFVGHVEAIQMVELQARVGGVLEQVNFKEGSDVQTGDVLYCIEQAPYRARVNSAKARVSKAEAALTRANHYLKRIRNVRSGGISSTNIESAEADVLEAGAEVQGTRSALDLAELDLGYTIISAPISGRIGATALTKGNLCGPTSGPLARIVQLDPIRVQYSVSENDLSVIKMAFEDSSLKHGERMLRLQIRLPGGKVLPLSGHVDFVDNEVDDSTGTISVRLIFDNPASLLLPGQYVTVLIARNKTTLLPVIPQSAVLEDREGRYVLVVNAENKVLQRRVTTGVLSGLLWAIESGLRVGEMVIVQGIQKVHPGQTVKTKIDSATKKD